MVITARSVGSVAFLANREQDKDTGSTDDFIRYTRQDTRLVV